MIVVLDATGPVVRVFDADDEGRALRERRRAPEVEREQPERSERSVLPLALCAPTGLPAGTCPGCGGDACPAAQAARARRGEPDPPALRRVAPRGTTELQARVRVAQRAARDPRAHAELTRLALALASDEEIDPEVLRTEPAKVLAHVHRAELRARKPTDPPATLARAAPTKGACTRGDRGG